FLLDFLGSLIALHDAGQQVPVFRIEALESRVLIQQYAAFGQALLMRQRPELTSALPIREELAEIADQVIGLDGSTINGQELARRNFHHVQVGGLVRAAARALAIRGPKNQALDVGRNLASAEHESRLL